MLGVSGKWSPGRAQHDLAETLSRSVISSKYGGCVIIPREDGYIRFACAARLPKYSGESDELIGCTLSSTCPLQGHLLLLDK